MKPLEHDPRISSSLQSPRGDYSFLNYFPSTSNRITYTTYGPRKISKIRLRPRKKKPISMTVLNGRLETPLLYTSPGLRHSGRYTVRSRRKPEPVVWCPIRLGKKTKCSIPNHCLFLRKKKKKTVTKYVMTTSLYATGRK